MTRKERILAWVVMALCVIVFAVSLVALVRGD